MHKHTICNINTIHLSHSIKHTQQFNHKLLLHIYKLNQLHYTTLQPSIKQPTTMVLQSNSNNIHLTQQQKQLLSTINNDYVPTKSLLSDKAILKHIELCNVIIEPFNLANLSTSSYDVTLGEYYYRESVPDATESIYNPYSESDVYKVWGTVKQAELASEWCKRTGLKLTNIQPTDRIIWLKPNETILGHTNEYIGGCNSITTMMKARSSMGRNFIEVCKCAGWYVLYYFLTYIYID